MRTNEYVFNLRGLNTRVYYTDEEDKYYAVNSYATTKGKQVSEAIGKNIAELERYLNAMITKCNGIYKTDRPIESVPAEVKIMTIDEIKMLALLEEEYLNLYLEIEKSPLYDYFSSCQAPSVCIIKDTKISAVYETVNKLASAFKEGGSCVITYQSLPEWELVEKVLEKIAKEKNVKIIIANSPLD